MNRDFKELLSTFNAQAVEYLVVGAHALASHGHVRATKDLDIWIRPGRENALHVLDALRDFGAPLHGLDEEDLATPGLIFQIGVAPVRIDILTAIDGVGSIRPPVLDEPRGCRLSSIAPTVAGYCGSETGHFHPNGVHSSSSSGLTMHQPPSPSGGLSPPSPSTDYVLS